MEKVLRQEIVEKIFNDAILFGKVADTLDVKPVTLPRLLYGNHKKLTHWRVLVVIKEHLNIKQDNKILTDKKEPIAA